MVEKYVILNFQDNADPVKTNVAKGIKVKTVAGTDGKLSTQLPSSITGSAQATVEGIAAKRTYGQNQNEVVHYSGIELLQALWAENIYKGASGWEKSVKPVRGDIKQSRKVYIVLHGKPMDTEDGHSHSKDNISWKELGEIAQRIFPLRDHAYRVALLMCYGARTDNYRLNHLGKMNAGDVESSFAFKFYAMLREGHRNGMNMTACTGAVSTEPDGRHIVETEDYVDWVIDDLNQKAKFARAKARNEQKGLAAPRISPTTQAKLDAKADEAMERHSNQIKRAKYGRILYTDRAGRLQVINKYGDPLNKWIGPDYVLYDEYDECARMT